MKSLPFAILCFEYLECTTPLIQSLNRWRNTQSVHSNQGNELCVHKVRNLIRVKSLVAADPRQNFFSPLFWVESQKSARKIICSSKLISSSNSTPISFLRVQNWTIHLIQ